ncbi:serine/threonine-protein kinase [Pokkaliibacter sp. CJK22405]|uniref:serine/threonine-protein kinase n=1 Tax=Pokkaliibacter sp. CJK22405 TaxID=3384615 RepID=UPI00398556FD
MDRVISESSTDSEATNQETSAQVTPQTATPETQEAKVKATSSADTAPHSATSSEATDDADMTTVFSDTTQVLETPVGAETGSHNQLKGTTLENRYLLEDQIGRGGMCDIYRARDLLLESEGIKDCHVAVKILQPHLLEHPQAQHLLIAEARKSQQLSHPNVIRVFSVGQERLANSTAPRTYLVMEWLDGETLDTVIKSSRPRGLNYEGAMKILRQISEALAYASSQGVVHADLKPSNIMLTRKGLIKVLDFGVASDDPLHKDIYAAPDPEATAPVQGYTPAYASPQLLEGAMPTHRDDVYSFSCIAYELLTSKHPYQRKPADKARAEKVKAEKPAHLNGKQWSALKDGLQFENNKRPKEVAQILENMDKKSSAPKFVAAAAVVVVLAGAAYAGQQAYQDYQNKLGTLDQQIAQTHKLDYLKGADAATLLDALESANAEDRTEVLGYVQSQRPAILDYFDSQVEAALKQQDSGYPDYYAVTDKVKDALGVFPDSARLQTLESTLEQSWLSSTQALDDQLNTMLEQGKYQTAQDYAALMDHLKGLQQLNRDYKPLPSTKATETYTSAMQTALSKGENNAELDTLRKVGEVFFAGMPEVDQSVTEVNEVQQAKQTMEAYNTAKESGQKVEFPYSAADVALQDRVDALSEEIASAADSTSLQTAKMALAELTREVPEDFEPAQALWHQLAETYRQQGNQLVDANQLRDAQKLFSEADRIDSQHQ